MTFCANSAVVWRRCADHRRPVGRRVFHVFCIPQTCFLPPAQTATRTAGGRAFFLQGPLCQLQLGLINYAMNFLIAREYTPMYPPFFMTKEAMGAVAQLSDFDDQLYKVCGRAPQVKGGIRELWGHSFGHSYWCPKTSTFFSASVDFTLLPSHFLLPLIASKLEHQNASQSTTHRKQRPGEVQNSTGHSGYGHTNEAARCIGQN